jgi:hypothetical protein
MLRQVLEEREDVIVERWLDRVLAAYPADGSAVFKRRTDQFANPVGHASREGTRTLFRTLRTERPDEETVARSLGDLLRIRAVQQMPPSTAVGFVLELKGIVRDELEGRDPSEELLAFEGRVDDLALRAFDLYTALREELAQLKVREARRHVSWIVDRLNAGADTEVPAELVAIEDTRVRGESC